MKKLLVRTAGSKKYGEFKFYISFDSVTSRYMMWQAWKDRFEGTFISATTEKDAIDYVNSLKYGMVGAIKTVIK